ncbi:tetratricopeptide repeat protein [Malaciobacter molluscorum]|uniref:tetratricopeptide repeat protein n=1 Tax=Malaciobacter molluscorum TaxID=1032072 RepID=UPI001D195EEC|nr:tetratricopeptide repeat protein [Malaciobacter molluscorum]
MKKKLFNFFFIFFYCTVSYAQKEQIESQPEIIFNYDKIKEKQNSFSLQFDFNKAVLMMEKKEYKKAIELFKQTATAIKIPSFLNIAIAYYKLGEIDNAKLYLNNIYNYKKAIYKNTYSYMSACYYLYQISKDTRYLDIIIDIAKKHKNLTEHSKRMLADTLILLKDYPNALKVLNSMKFPLNLKKALLHLKLRNYDEANKFLLLAKEKAVNQELLNKIIWIMTYRDLKANDLEKLRDNIDLLNKRKSNFKVNLELPLKIYFNKDKYSSKEYLDFITNFSMKRKIDYVFYFAPFIFSDSQEIIYDMSKGFIFKSKQNIKSLESMVEYNAKFIEIIKKDPIIRVDSLKKLITNDTKSYVYYNLALSYAQIFDFNNAYKFFRKAYKLNPGNKLYAVMTLISAQRVNKKVSDIEYIKSNIKSANGLYKYFALSLYNLFIDKTYKVKDKTIYYKDSIFYKAIDYMKEKQENKDTSHHDLLQENIRDPFVYLMSLVKREKNENDFEYFSRLQRSVPLYLNDNFLEGPLIVTEYYFDVLRAIGLFNKANLIIENDNNPSYLRTKAVVQLYKGDSKQTLKILDEIQSKYKLEDKYTMYLQVAALLDQNKYNEASVQLSLIKALLDDDDADFLTGVQLLEDLKFSSVKQYFRAKYIDNKIDFKLDGLDEFLESL